MKVQKTASFALALLLAAASALAQQTTQNEAPLTNKDVLQMISMGLSEGVIVDKIHATKATNFDISMDALKSLKDAKVPDAVVHAMIQASSAAHATDQPAAPNPDDPASPHDAGVWVLVNGKMKQIEASSFSGQKMGMGSAMLTMGMGKSHAKATLRNAHAVVQLTDPNPEFYFYFEKSAAASTFSYTGPAPTSPSGYQLVRLEVKKDTRETVVVTMGGLGGGMSSGPEKKDIVDFSSVKIGSGIFKVTVSKPLKPGEYCFTASSGGMGGAMMGGGQVYDFGVSAGSK
jgi:hypothetical protein